MATKNILELCLAHGLGGLEMFVAHCYEDFSQKTVCKVVVAPHSKLDKYLENVEKFHIKRNKFFPFIPAWYLAKYIDENEIDIIHFHWTRDSITAVLAKLFSKRKPKIVQSRHMGMTRFKDDFFHRWIYNNIDMIHAVTKEVQGQLEHFIPEYTRPEIQTIYLGVEAQQKKKNSSEQLKEKYQLSDEFLIGIVGRIEKPKGQYKVIEALAKLQDINVKLFIVGAAMEDEYLDKLQQKVYNLGIEDRVIFTGFTKDVDAYMQLFDVTILATEHETFGLVVIESMLASTPVIALAKGGPLEIIEDGVDGLLFDGSDEELAKKIRLLYKNHTLYQDIKEQAYKTVKKRFDKRKQFEKLYYTMVQ